MNRAMFTVMALRLWRDRGSLALAFLLPPAIFVIFAAIFAGTSGENLELRVAWLDQVGSERSQALRDALERDPQLRLLTLAGADREAAVRRRVRAGDIDAAVVVTAPLAQVGGNAPLRVVADESRAMAGPMFSGRIRQSVAEALPQVLAERMVATVEELAGPLSDEQRLRLAETEVDGERQGLLRVEALSRESGAAGAVSYYAGAVALLFLLFSAMQGAATVIDERRAGIVDRLLLGPGGARAVLLGKWGFLTAQGVAQVALIFAVAWLGYGVDWPGHLGLWLVTTAVAAAAASSLGLALATACTTRQQAQTLSTFAVLILSAVGGSMVPRFLMPPWLRELGWLTPNAWAIEAYQGLFWRGQGAAELWPAWGVLAGVAVGAMLLAWALAARWART